MKIVYDYQIFLLQHYGGISRYFYELAKNINELNGIDTAKINAGIYVNQYLNNDDFVNGFKYRGSFSRLYYNRFYNKTNETCVLISSFYNKRSHCDIYHETYYNSKVSKPAGSALVTTIHDMIYEKFPEQFVNAKEEIENKKKSILNAAHVIAVSENTKKDIIDIYNINSEKISVVYHGVSQLGKVQTFGENAIKKPYLLFVGRRQGYKNAKLLLETYIADIELQGHLDLVFFGGEKQTPEENKLLNLANLSSNVHFLSGNDDLLATFYSKAFAFIYPSIYEGFGMPCLEAMYYNCPVISSNTSSIPEVTGNAVQMFNPYDPQSLGLSITRLTNNNLEREKFITLGKERIKLFTWKNTAENTLAVYHKIKK